MVALTPRQKELFDYVKDHIAEHGFSPSLKQMATKLKTTTPHISNLLSQLHHRGAIVRHKGKRNGVELPGPMNSITPDMIKAGRTAMLNYTVNDFRYRPEVIAKHVFEAMMKGAG